MREKDKPKSPYETYTKPNWWKRNWITLVTIIVGAASINSLFISKSYWGNTVDPAKAGQFGDFIGGYIGTFFALVSVVLLYLTLHNQRRSSEIEKFENRFFELLKLHRDNVAEIGIGKDYGKKIFVMMIREFREILKVAKQVSNSNGLNYDNEKLFVAAYCGLFFGTGPNSSRIFKDSLFEFCECFKVAFEKELNNYEKKKYVKKERKFKYTPFEGHQSRLGHYFRHLYQAVSYVDNRDIDIDKYEYVKTLRAQLSTHEQGLLFINSLCPMGKEWNNKGLLLRYRLVKNLPPHFFDKETELDITGYFPNDYFEWQEN